MSTPFRLAATKRRVIVTGGSGKVGRHVISHLLKRRCEILNLDLVPLAKPLADQVHTLIVDLSDSGQVFSAVGSHFRCTEPFQEDMSTPPDALIHLAGYARNMIVPDNRTFVANVSASYNVLEAACKLGIRKVLIASSICVYGVTFAEGDTNFASYPVTEDIDARPMDAYSLSKLCTENISRGFSLRFPEVDIYCFRIGAVFTPEDYSQFGKYISRPQDWKVHGWSYTDVNDFARLCYCALLKDGLRFQVFNAVNNKITNEETSTMEFLKRANPDVTIRKDIEGTDAPISNYKARKLLGFEAHHSWRQSYTPSRASKI